MYSFVVLFNKEMKSNWRTYRFLIAFAVFLVIGLGTPLLLRYLHIFLPGDESGIVLPEFTAADAAAGYFDSVGQMGLLLAILLSMGSVASERGSGTAAMTLCKPVGCGSFISAKLAALVLVFTLGIILGALCCYFYTVILFDNLSVSNFIAATFLSGLYLIMCIAVTVMFSCFFRSQLAAGGLALLTLIVLTVTSGLPVMKDYGPGALLSWSKDVVSGSAAESWGALAVSVGIIILTTIIGWQVFKRKEL